jgi:small conductance mechanosensitive channel
MELNIQQLVTDLFVTAAQFTVLAVIGFALAWLSDLGLRQARRLPLAERVNLDAVRTTLRRSLLIGFLVLLAAMLAFNLSLVIRGQTVIGGTLDLIRTSIPAGFWTRLGIGLLQVALIVVVTRVTVRLIRRFLPALERRVAAIEAIRTSDKQVRMFFGTLAAIVQNGLWALAAGLSARALGLPDVVAGVIFVGLRVYLIIAMGRLIISVLGTVINTLDALSERYIKSSQLDAVYTQMQQMLPLFNRTLEFVIYIGAFTLALSQIEQLEQLARYGTIALQLIGIFFLSRVAVEVVHVLLDRFFLVREDHLTDAQWQQRLTFTPLIKSASRYGVYFTAILLALVSLGFDIGPILVGLGGIGLVLGLAAQPVTTDLISGLFILFENLFLVGDYIETGNARGTVESIDVRTTRIRDPDGQLHLVRNGQIGDIVNYSKGYVYAVVIVNVAEDVDLDRAFAVIEVTGRVLNDANDDMLEATIVQGIEEFGDDVLVLRTLTRVRPGKHQQVARELRRAIKQAFDEAGIAMSAPASHVAQVVLSPTALQGVARQERPAPAAPAAARDGGQTAPALAAATLAPDDLLRGLMEEQGRSVGEGDGPAADGALKLPI